MRGQINEQAARKETMDSDILRLDASALYVSEVEESRVVKTGRTSLVIETVSWDGYSEYWAWKRSWS
jgi:hypothetical protein